MKTYKKKKKAKNNYYGYQDFLESRKVRQEVYRYILFTCLSKYPFPSGSAKSHICGDTK